MGLKKISGYTAEAPPTGWEFGRGEEATLRKQTIVLFTND